MKTTEHEEAQQLYFQTNLTKTEIASRLNVSRQTITLWAHQGNWDSLRRSARTMPALVAEKCYHLLDTYTSGLLGDAYTAANINIKHAQTIHLLASSIRKIKNRSTVNESMEMFNFFLGGLSRRNPELAAQVTPEVEQYIYSRGESRISDHLTDEFCEDGTIPFPEKEINENWADEKDAKAISEEFELFLRQREDARQAIEQVPYAAGPGVDSPNPGDDTPPVITDANPGAVDDDPVGETAPAMEVTDTIERQFAVTAEALPVAPVEESVTTLVSDGLDDADRKFLELRSEIDREFAEKKKRYEDGIAALQVRGILPADFGTHVPPPIAISLFKGVVYFNSFPVF